MSRKVTIKGSISGPESSDYPENRDHSDSSAFRFEINLMELARILFEKRRLIAGITLAVMVLSAAYLFLQPNLLDPCRRRKRLPRAHLPCPHS